MESGKRGGYIEILTIWSDSCESRHESAQGLLLLKIVMLVKDDVPPWYADTNVCQSRARLDYGMSGSASVYGDTYAESFGLLDCLGDLTWDMVVVELSFFTGISFSVWQSSWHGLSVCKVGSVSNSVGMYSTSYSSNYLSRGPDVGSSSYLSLYFGRSLSSGCGYLGSGGSGSYY
ncbi:uncharacterized protein LOC131248566 [Magnolia sinica]|uniref:uncharacterized protein LOC131248566 n=1 Tax=Magnolia sinica TaxID=86752 RepID=UPI00265B3116|nr:uncharacterized protein LOC131248566 [Magnolia sinica]